MTDEDNSWGGSFERLERELVEAHYRLADEDPQNPLLEFIEVDNCGFVFTPKFDAAYNGMSVIKRYEAHTDNLRNARDRFGGLILPVL